uniref:Reverse transcriptase domain-containing protein n=1 Tax=Parastrongyloides trichosuri TaxID=131310 RepID=A0A0N4Z1C8_PARTI
MGKTITAKTFRENVARYITEERTDYVERLKDVSPGRKSRPDGGIWVANNERTNPPHLKYILDQISKKIPIETKENAPTVHSPEKKRRKLASVNTISELTELDRLTSVTPTTTRKRSIRVLSRLDNPTHTNTSVLVSPEKGTRPKQAKINPNTSKEVHPVPNESETLEIAQRQPNNQEIGNFTQPIAERAVDETILDNISRERQDVSIVPRTKGKSKRHETESKLTSQEKVDMRRKNRIGTPYGLTIPLTKHTKKANELEGKTTEERFIHFMNQQNMPKCQRWDNTKKVPIVEINHIGEVHLKPLIAKLMDPKCTQATYEEVNKQWPKIAIAMMLTAQSYVYKTNNAQKCAFSKAIQKRKRAERQLTKMSKAWKNRHIATNKSTAILAKIRIKAKNHKISPISYISRMNEIVAQFKNKEKIEAKKALDRKIRYMFDKSGSIKTVFRMQEGTTPKVPVDEGEAFKFYKQLHTVKPTPKPLAISEWAETWQHRPITHTMVHVNEFLTSKLKHSSPFKTPGPNMVYPAAFKRFKSLAKLLEAKVNGLLTGKFTLTVQEMTAKAFLLPKTKIPSTDPSDYRAINCINADIKYVNAVTYEFIYHNSFKYLAVNQSAAFKGLPGTLHAMMVNNAILKQHKKSTSVLYVDMKKAFDSVSHTSIKMAVSALNIPNSIKTYIHDMLGKGGFTISNSKTSHRSKNHRVDVQQGVMQGCALAPCLFVIAMDIISYQLNKMDKLEIGKEINTLPNNFAPLLNKKFSLGKNELTTHSGLPFAIYMNEQKDSLRDKNISVPKTVTDDVHLDRRAENRLINHISFVDDVKIYAKNNSTLRTMKNIFERVAKQLGLHVNAKKCGVVYNKVSDDNARLEDIEELEGCYKYLGIPELGRSVSVEQIQSNLEDKIIKCVCKVFSTKMNIGQKIRWYNSSIAPAVAYVVTHALPATRKKGLIAMCARLDTLVGKILAGGISGFETIEVRQMTTALPRLFCSHTKGGLGLTSLKTVAYESTVRHMMSLWMEQANSQVKGLYVETELKGGMTTPISQFMYVMKELGMTVQLLDSGIKIDNVYYGLVNQGTRDVAKLIREKRDNEMYQKWTKNLDFAKMFDELKLEMPWLKKAAVSDLQANIIMSSQQQSLPGLNWHIQQRQSTPIKVCPLCQKVLTTSHIISGCSSNTASLKYTTRHDAVLASVTNSILKSIGVGFKSLDELRKLREDDIIGKDWSISFDTPQRVSVGNWRDDDVAMATNNDQGWATHIAHNRPDLLLLNHTLKKAVLLEVAIVGNPKSIEKQMEIKRVRYMKNSQEVIGPDNYDKVAAAYNMQLHLHKKYGEDYTVNFVPFVIGSYGEIIPGFIKDHMNPLTALMSEEQIKATVASASRIAAVHTVYVIRYWLSLTRN